jgi:methylmalonyl-CoA/ethylmalonyl-CoA epimerase
MHIVPVAITRWSHLQTFSKSVEIVQIGILVRDVEEAARKLEKLIGIGPFQILEPEYRDLTLHGRPARFKIRIALAKAGPIQIELTQPLSGETIYDEYARRKEYGLHHLAIRAENMEESITEMKARGFKVIQSGNRPGTKWAYLDTEEQTGIIFELVEKKEA